MICDRLTYCSAVCSALYRLRGSFHLSDIRNVGLHYADITHTLFTLRAGIIIAPSLMAWHRGAGTPAGAPAGIRPSYSCQSGLQWVPTQIEGVFSISMLFYIHCKYLNARFECNDIVITLLIRMKKYLILRVTHLI